MAFPVDQTFKDVLFAMDKTFPQLKPVAVQPGYNPIVYQLEGVLSGRRFVLHMEGAEPGVPGHDFRFSLLYGYVLRAKP